MSFLNRSKIRTQIKVYKSICLFIIHQWRVCASALKHEHTHHINENVTHTHSTELFHIEKLTMRWKYLTDMLAHHGASLTCDPWWKWYNYNRYIFLSVVNRFSNSVRIYFWIIFKQSSKQCVLKWECIIISETTHTHTRQGNK